jgi:hypothetical protein
MHDAQPASISPSGEITELLNALTDKPLAEIFEQLKAEKRKAEAGAKHLTAICRSDSSADMRGLRHRMFEYAQSIRCLLHWLYSGGWTKPRNCDQFPLFRPMAESLVNRGLLAAGALALFHDTSAPPDGD